MFTETGQIKEDGGEPDGFAQSRYDHQPSTLSFTKVDKDFNNVELANTFDLQDAALQNKQFENEFKFNQNFLTKINNGTIEIIIKIKYLNNE